MSEGNVYVCHWVLRKGKYEARIDGVPRRRVVADSFDELTIAIGELLITERGDGEPVLEFEPPYLDATGAKAVLRNDWVATYLNDAVRVNADNALFTGGFCTNCDWPVGDRTSKPLEVRREPHETRYKSIAAVTNHSMRLPILSARTLNLFTAQERDTFDARPVDIIPPGRLRWFEIVPRLFINEIAVRSLTPSGWVCKGCGRRCISHPTTLGWGPAVITRESIGADASMFFLGDAGNFEICFTKPRWAEIKAEMRSVGLTSNAIAIVSAADRELNPFLDVR